MVGGCGWGKRGNERMWRMSGGHRLSVELNGGQRLVGISEK